MSIYQHGPRAEDSLLNRRQLLRKCGMGMGGLALAQIMAQAGLAISPSTARADAINPLAPRPPQFAAKAKRIIHIFANGGPSQVDTFDPKPMLTKFAGKALPMDYLPTERKTGAALASPFKFEKQGKSGIEVSELFSHVAESIDDICVIRSMNADVPNHEPSLLLMNCGESRLIRPSMGSWLTYGLGTENQNLPGFVVLCPGGYPIQESQNWQSAFLPGTYQGTYVDTQHTDIAKLIEHVNNPAGVSADEQRRQLDLLQQLNRRHGDARGRETDLEARIQSFELAYRMQMDAADAFDVSREPKHIRDMYGDGTQARQILIARRLIERGVRFVQVWHGAGQPWDNHDDLEVNHRNLAKQCDQAIGALLKDSKAARHARRHAGHLGRRVRPHATVELPHAGSNAGKINGRDHNHYGFTMWLAGGGIKGGYVHGATDDFGFKAVENQVHVHDLHATILHLMGFDHETFTYRYAGRDFRLTDVHGHVVKELLA
jgi:hypothetical protein